MIEQYVYTRADNMRTSKTFGHGIAYSTDGIEDSAKTGISTVSRYSGDTKDSSGSFVKVIEKRRISTSKGSMVIQQSVLFPERRKEDSLLDQTDERLLHLSSTFRAQFLTHGYLCGMNDVSASIEYPDKWFYPNFIDYNVNISAPILEKYETLPGEPTPLLPLKRVLAEMNISIETFTKVIFSCLITNTEPTITLVEIDYQKDNAYETAAQFLRWVYHFLPFSVRRNADFSTCYDLKCGGSEYCITLVPSSMLVEERGRKTVKHAPNSVKYGYLFSNDQCYHINLNGKADPDYESTNYGSWLKNTINDMLELGTSEQLNKLQEIDEYYSAIDIYLKTQLEDTQCSFDVLEIVFCLCRHHLAKKAETDISSDDNQKAEIDPQTVIDILLSFQDKSVLKPDLRVLLRQLCKILREGYTNEKMRLLCTISNEINCNDDVEEVMDVFLAKLVDSGDEELGEKLSEYFALRRGEANSAESKYKSMERVIFAKEKDERQRKYWSWAGVEYSQQACEARGRAWLNTFVSEAQSCEDYLRQTENVLEMLSAFSPSGITEILGSLMHGDTEKDTLIAFQYSDVSFADMKNCVLAKNRVTERFTDKKAKIVVENYYANIEKQLEKACIITIDKRLTTEKATIIDLLKELEETFAMYVDNDDCRRYWKYFSEKLIEILLERVNVKNDTFANVQLRDLINDDENLHATVVDIIGDLNAIRVDKSLLAGLYRQTVNRMIEEDCHYSYRTGVWFKKFSDLFNSLPTALFSEKQKDETWQFTVPICVSKFLNRSERDRTYTQLCELLKRYKIVSKNEMRVLTCLWQLFKRNELRHVEPEVILCYGIKGLNFSENKDMDKKIETCARVFAILLKAYDANTFIRIINGFGSAELASTAKKQTSEEKSKPRSKLPIFPKTLSKSEIPSKKGTYDWMKANLNMIKSLKMSIKKYQDVYKDAAANDAMFCPNLISAIFLIAYPGTAVHSYATEINRQLQEYWKECSPSSSAAKKEMSKLNKNGAFKKFE